MARGVQFNPGSHPASASLSIVDNAEGRIRTCEPCPPQTRALSLISIIAKALIDEYPTPDAGPLAEFVSTLAEILPRGEM
jgi:hypothetical protein